MIYVNNCNKSFILWMLTISLHYVSYYTIADEIVLNNGDVIHGTITERTGDFLVLEHPDLGTFKIPSQRIQSFAIQSNQELASLEQNQDMTAPEDDLPDTVWYTPEFNRLNSWAAKKKDQGFNISLDFSMDGSWGNTDEQSFRFGSIVKRELPETRARADLTYYHKTQDNETSDDKLSVGLRKDWLKPDSKWFYFMESRYDYDDFESWKYRLSGHAGPGYIFFDTRKLRLSLLAGPGARKEWESINDNVRFEGVTGLDFIWNISKRQKITGFTGYYPVLTDFDDYRTRSSLNWRFLMDRELKLSFILGLEHEYLNIVDPGNDKNDTRVYVGIRHDL